jgi:SAM-dependent methyltransferase
VSFDRVAEEYDATRPLPRGVSEEITDAIVGLTGATPETEFLEVGVGTGRIAAPLVERGYRLTGIDISQEMMARFRRKLGGDRPNLTLLEADAAGLPVPDASFDVALTVHLLHLVAGWRDALSELRRALRPRGVFLYGYEEHTPGPALRELLDRWEGLLSARDAGPGRPGGSVGEVREELRRQGAQLETIVAARWRGEVTVGELLDLYERRVYSSLWRLPDDVFGEAMRGLREWSAGRYPSEGFALSRESAFVIVAARHWAEV